MSEAGYVYALINWSMPGLVKVGITSRTPDERSDELSSATGVPTPFERVFHVLVPDARAAESEIHGKLEARGYRVSGDREFFRAPIEEVVLLLLAARDASPSVPLEGPSDPQYSTPTPVDRDPLFRQAAECCIQNELGSTSLLQRRLKIGYGRAARLIDELHDAGVLGPPDESKARQVLVGLEDLDRH